MKIQPVIFWLQATLPLLTNVFSDILEIEALTYNGAALFPAPFPWPFVYGQVTAVTASPHNLVTGNIVNISGAIIPNPLTSLTTSEIIATAVTENNHDLTEGFQSFVTIKGCDNNLYNGDFPLLTVPNRKTFTFQLPAPDMTTPGGNPVLMEYLPIGAQSYNGYYRITVISPNEFTYNINSIPLENGSGTIKLSSKTRISGAISIERAIESYTKQGAAQMWLFVVPDETIASQDRNTHSDATAQFADNDMYWQRILENISVYVFCPTINSIAARQEHDLIEEEVVRPLLSVLCGKKFYDPFGAVDWSRMIFVDHGFFAYPSPYYIHRFRFQLQRDLTYADLLPGYSVAFRDIYMQFLENDNYDANEIMSAHIDLDDVPLT